MSFQRTKSLRSAILQSFHAVTDAALAERLREFSERDWRKLGSWMQASGIGLYFLAELERREIKHALPGSIAREWTQNLADNRKRTLALRSEFIRLNAEFREAGLDFLNVKGFSLGVEYCPDPALRQQFDLDFWVPDDQAQLAECTMQRLGYRVYRSGNSLECQAGDTKTPSLDDFYKPPTQRMAEIHLRPKAEFAVLPRRNVTVNAFVFPTLSREQTFLYHALHITKHLRSEFTRASWLLELRNAIRQSHTDLAFWQNVREQCPGGETAVLVGVAVAFAVEVFRFEVPEELASWTVRKLPARASTWVEEFAETIVTANFPGTKLYLLLNEVLDATQPMSPGRTLSSLLPVRVPGFIRAQGSETRSLEQIAANAAFVGRRLRFHAVEGLRILRAGRQWSGTRSIRRERALKQGSSIA